VGLQERSSIIDQLATELKAPVLAYVTGDRPNLQTQVASEAVVRFIRTSATSVTQTSLCSSCTHVAGKSTLRGRS